MFRVEAWSMMNAESMLLINWKWQFVNNITKFNISSKLNDVISTSVAVFCVSRVLTWWSRCMRLSLRKQCRRSLVQNHDLVSSCLTFCHYSSTPWCGLTTVVLTPCLQHRWKPSLKTLKMINCHLFSLNCNSLMNHSCCSMSCVCWMKMLFMLLQCLANINARFNLFLLLWFYICLLVLNSICYLSAI